MKGIKQLSVGLGCMALFAMFGCNARSVTTGYDAGVTSFHSPAPDMDSGMPKQTSPGATLQARASTTTSAWDAGY